MPRGPAHLGAEPPRLNQYLLHSACLFNEYSFKTNLVAQKKQRAFLGEEPQRNVVDAVSDKERRKDVDGVVDMAEQHYCCEEYRRKQEEPLETVVKTPKRQRAEERHPRMGGKELVRAEKGVGNSRSEVAQIRDLRRSEVSHKRKRRADEYKKRHCMQRKGDALRVHKKHDHAYRHDKERAVYKKPVDFKNRNIGEDNVGDRVARVVGRLVYRPKIDEQRADERDDCDRR